MWVSVQYFKPTEEVVSQIVLPYALSEPKTVVIWLIFVENEAFKTVEQSID